MIPSPKVATYDKEPKMSVQGVADKVAEVVRKAEHEFIMCNFAPPDMVGLLSSYQGRPSFWYRLATPEYTRLQWKR